MKILLDTEKKVIKVEKTISLGELIENLGKMLPHGEWQSFKIEAQTQINYTPSPIVIKEYPYKPQSPTPWYSPYYTTCLKETI